jgi:hypothetical protein
MRNGENGDLIDAANDVGDVRRLAVSDDGSFFAAASWGTVGLWSAVGGRFSHIDSIKNGREIYPAFSCDLLGMASYID